MSIAREKKRIDDDQHQDRVILYVKKKKSREGEGENSIFFCY